MYSSLDFFLKILVVEDKQFPCKDNELVCLRARNKILYVIIDAPAASHHLAPIDVHVVKRLRNNPVCG